jgi:hypothetical protein
MNELKYKTIFSSQIKAVISEDKDKYLSLASLVNIGDFIPDIDLERNLDLLPVAFNAFVANRVNKNGDVIDTETAIAIHENFLNKPINIEHNRNRVIGTILTAGFSEFGTDKTLSLEQVKDTVGPFNVTLGGVIWRIVNDEVSTLIEDSSDPTNENYQKVSASWELGFSDFNIILLKNNEKNIENGEVIADEARIEELQDHLKAFGGEGYVDSETQAYRQVIGKVVPLGIGLTETPAADVKGISTKKTVENKENNLAKEAGETNNISQNPNTDVIPKENIMKIESIKDITDESLKETSASAVADFIESELKKASEEFSEEKGAYEKQLEEAKENGETLSKEHEELKEKLVSVEKSLAELEQEKQKRETQQRFNERMSGLDEEYELNDEDREVIASDIKDMNNEDFETYSKKLSILLKEKNKEVLAKKETEEKQEAEKQQKEVKASEVVEEQETATSIESVVEEAQQEDEEGIPNSTTAEEETLAEKYKKAFTIDQFDIVK